GRDATSAVEIVLHAGLIPVVVADYDARAAAGRVRLQSPAAGSTAHAGTAVSLQIGAGFSPQMVDVPNVVGLSSADAVARVRRAGFSALILSAGARSGVFVIPDQVVGQM